MSTLPLTQHEKDLVDRISASLISGVAKLYMLAGRDDSITIPDGVKSMRGEVMILWGKFPDDITDLEVRSMAEYNTKLIAALMPLSDLPAVAHTFKHIDDIKTAHYAKWPASSNPHRLEVEHELIKQSRELLIHVKKRVETHPHLYEQSTLQDVERYCKALETAIEAYVPGDDEWAGQLMLADQILRESRWALMVKPEVVQTRPSFTSDVDQYFYDTYSYLLSDGTLKGDRTGHGTLATVGVMGRFDISHGRAALPSTKELITRSSYNEMISLFIAGTSSIKGLRDKKIGIWDDWFIPGTDSYDEPSEPYLLEYRATLAREAGLEKELFEYMEGYHDEKLVYDEPYGTYAIIGVEITPAYTSGHDLFSSEVKQIEDWLTAKGIPTHRKPGGKPVSLQKRLSRVSKNDVDKWDRINAVTSDIHADKVSYPDKVSYLPGDMIEITVFREGKFKDVTISPRRAVLLTDLLGRMGVNAYPLLDADIGEGSYGRQWRHWQDTQLCGDSTEEFEAYMDQGYECVGTFKNAHNAYMTCVMHREVDQLQNAVDKLKTNPDDRRIIISAWNPGRIWQAALPPCHLYIQFISHEMTLAERESWLEHYVSGEEKELEKAFAAGGSFPAWINGEKYAEQSAGISDEAKRALLDEFKVPKRKLFGFVLLRSNDMALGAPFNIAQYSLLTHMVAHVTGHATAELITMSVDAHLYLNQLDGINEQLTRSSYPGSDARISFKRKVDSIDDFTYDDIELKGYLHHPAIKMDVAV